MPRVVIYHQCATASWFGGMARSGAMTCAGCGRSFTRQGIDQHAKAARRRYRGTPGGALFVAWFTCQRGGDVDVHARALWSRVIYRFDVEQRRVSPGREVGVFD